MNSDNIKKAIVVMVRAKYFRMLGWQTRPGDTIESFDKTITIARTEKELNYLRNYACFAGHIAVSPEFIKDGGHVDRNSGIPVFENHRASDAIARWLDIGFTDAKLLVYGYVPDKENTTDPDYCLFYEKESDQITPSDIIEKLKYMLGPEQ